VAGDEAHLKVSRESFEKALKVKEAFLQEKKRKIDEVQRAVAVHKQAQWEKHVADAMESFEVGGIDQTHDEMIDRINRESAKHQARMEMALNNIDAAGLEIEKEAQKMQANELLKQFEIELGLATPQPVEQRTLGPAEPAAAPVEGETSTAEPVAKTVGPKKITNP
jgi:phage shock protein A